MGENTLVRKTLSAILHSAASNETFDRCIVYQICWRRIPIYVNVKAVATRDTWKYYRFLKLFLCGVNNLLFPNGLLFWFYSPFHIGHGQLSPHREKNAAARLCYKFRGYIHDFYKIMLAKYFLNHSNPGLLDNLMMIGARCFPQWQ